MSLLGEAFDAADGRMAGIIEATEQEGAGSTNAIPLTAAGTGLDGVELRDRIVEFVRAAASEEVLRGAEEELERSLVRSNHGSALCWFWAGYEARRLQERPR